MGKGKRLTFRYDDKLDKVLTEICDRDGCTKSELVDAVLREAFEDELNGKFKPAPAPSEVEKAIPIGRIRRTDNSKNEVRTVVIGDTKKEVVLPNGSIQVYKNGRLAYTKVPPRLTGGQWTYILHV